MFKQIFERIWAAQALIVRVYMGFNGRCVVDEMYTQMSVIVLSFR